MPVADDEKTVKDELDQVIDSLSLDEQLQLAAARVGGSMESKLTAMAVAAIVSRMVQLDPKDQEDLFECVKDFATIKQKQDAEETLKTIFEILHPNKEKLELIGVDEVVSRKPRENFESWLVWISQKISDLRSSKQMTQAELAQKTGLTQSHISRLEAGKHSPSRRTLEKIADALGVDVETLSLY